MKGLHAVVDRVEVFGRVEVVVTEDDGGTSLAKLIEGGLRQLLERLQLDVDELEASGGGVME